MTDHDALLRTICANPDDDTARLVFADWLDDHADAFPVPASVRQRAAFIRDDIAMSRRDEFDPLRLRWELIEKPQREAEPWTRIIMPSSVLSAACSEPFLFRRGFFWSVAVTPSRFLANAEALRLSNVPAPTLSYWGRDDSAGKLFTSPLFARVTGLRIQNSCLRPRALELLANSPHAAALKELSVGPGGLEAGAIHSLVRSKLFTRLTRWELKGPPSFGSLMVSSIRHVGQTDLREVSFDKSGLTGQHVERVLTAPAMGNLTQFSLAQCRLGLAGYEGLVRADLPYLRNLSLNNTSPGPEGIRLLSSSPTLARLHRLRFGSNHVNSSLMAELATCHEVSNLRVLEISGNPIGNGGASAIAHSPHFAGLLALDLSYSQVGDEGIEAILESSLADNLVLLDLRGSPASDEMKDVLKAKMGDRVRL